MLAMDSAMPNTRPAPGVQPCHQPIAMPSGVATSALRQRAGNGDGADRQQVLEREMQANPEHQQDDADFGELIGNALIGDEARRERADGDAGEQIADQRRQPQALGHEAEAEGEHKPHGERRDERSRMRHAKVPVAVEGRLAIRPANGACDKSLAAFSQNGPALSSAHGAGFGQRLPR